MKMMRYAILILLTLMMVACGSSPTPDSVATRVVVEESAHETMTANAPTAIPNPINTSTPVEKAMPTAVPISSSTATPTLGPIWVDAQAPGTRIKDGMAMVFVPAGDFIMGSPPGEGSDEEFPQHKVTLEAFWIDRTEVTNTRYRVFVDATGHLPPITCGWGDQTSGDVAYADHPVVCVSWVDAKAYCEWAGARLPTEAEWEKAARGTDGRMYPWGTIFDGNRLNYCDSNCDSSRINVCDTNCYSSQQDTTVNDGYARTAPVGSYPAGISPYGALDMAGNVWEWVSDWYKFGYYNISPQSNPQGPASGQYRVLRGGSWLGSSSNARSAFRAWGKPEVRDINIGFRCVVPSAPSP